MALSHPRIGITKFVDLPQWTVAVNDFCWTLQASSMMQCISSVCSSAHGSKLHTLIKKRLPAYWCVLHDEEHCHATEFPRMTVSSSASFLDEEQAVHNKLAYIEMRQRAGIADTCFRLPYSISQDSFGSSLCQNQIWSPTRSPKEDDTYKELR